MVDQDVVVTEPDCGTSNGFTMTAIVEGGDVVEPLRDRVLGRSGAGGHGAAAVYERAKSLSEQGPERGDLDEKSACQAATAQLERVHLGIPGHRPLTGGTKKPGSARSDRGPQRTALKITAEPLPRPSIFPKSSCSPSTRRRRRRPDRFPKARASVCPVHQSDRRCGKRTFQVIARAPVSLPSGPSRRQSVPGVKRSEPMREPALFQETARHDRSGPDP